ncbi:DNA ligase [Thiolapillus sp.]
MTRNWLLLLLLLYPLAVPAAEPKLLLLEKYQASINIEGWLMSEKLDGVRAYWDGRRLLTRKGNQLAAPDWFIQDLPPFELDGELWIARGNFEEILSVVSRETPHPGWRRITYNVFEAPNAAGGLKTRLGKLENYLHRHPITHVRIVQQITCRDDKHLLEYLAAVTDAGGEGVVLHNPESLYETGRSPNALKVKRFDDMEGTVLGYRPGKGKYLGKVGALWVEIEGGTRFFIGSGLNDEQRASPPAIGSLITFKYHGFSGNGVPRFASFLRVRNMQGSELKQ